jgi:hypothetical protein
MLVNRLFKKKLMKNSARSFLKWLPLGLDNCSENPYFCYNNVLQLGVVGRIVKSRECPVCRLTTEGGAAFSTQFQFVEKESLYELDD